MLSISQYPGFLFWLMRKDSHIDFAPGRTSDVSFVGKNRKLAYHPIVRDDVRALAVKTRGD